MNDDYVINTDEAFIKKLNPASELTLTDEDYVFIHKSAVIEVGGKVIVGNNKLDLNGRSSIIWLDEDSSLIFHGNFNFYYGADVRLFSGARLELGNNSYINSDCKIRCSNHIQVGDDCAISHDLIIMDSDFHKIDGIAKIGEVRIGNHVWIGTRVTILKNVSIGDGSIVAAGSVVTHNVPPKSMVAGVPARIIRKNVEWE